jgi:hypothetical protein
MKLLQNKIGNKVQEVWLSFQHGWNKKVLRLFVDNYYLEEIVKNNDLKALSDGNYFFFNTSINFTQ